MITQYIRHPKRGRIGVLLADKLPDTDHVTIGWSLCCKKDQWNKAKGRGIALRRILLERNVPCLFPNDDEGQIVQAVWESNVPHSIKPVVFTFALRAHKYFRISDISNVV